MRAQSTQIIRCSSQFDDGIIVFQQFFVAAHILNKCITVSFAFEIVQAHTMMRTQADQFRAPVLMTRRSALLLPSVSASAILTASGNR